jgi:hypothetical protein
MARRPDSYLRFIGITGIRTHTPAYSYFRVAPVLVPVHFLHYFGLHRAHELVMDCSCSVTVVDTSGWTSFRHLPICNTCSGVDSVRRILHGGVLDIMLFYALYSTQHHGYGPGIRTSGWAYSPLRLGNSPTHVSNGLRCTHLAEDKPTLLSPSPRSTIDRATTLRVAAIQPSITWDYASKVTRITSVSIARPKDFSLVDADLAQIGGRVTGSPLQYQG